MSVPSVKTNKWKWIPLRYIIAKLPEVKDDKKILRAVRPKRHINQQLINSLSSQKSKEIISLEYYGEIMIHLELTLQK